jgi:hypothetical protein
MLVLASMHLAGNAIASLMVESSGFTRLAWDVAVVTFVIYVPEGGNEPLPGRRELT